MHIFLQFERACKIFGEDYKTTQPEDFFGIFDQFLMSVSEAKTDNDLAKKKRVEEEKRAIMEQEVSCMSGKLFFFIYGKYYLFVCINPDS